MAKVLVSASGLNRTPFLGFEREHRQERDSDDGEAEEQRRSDLERGIGEDLRTGCAGRGAFEMLVRVLDHHDRGVDHGAECDRDAARLMMLELRPYR